MTYLSELLRQVMGSLLRNKLRSFLTMAGIAWGIASIVLIVAMGDGFKEGQRNNTKIARRKHRDPVRRPHRNAGRRATRRPPHPPELRRRRKHPARMLPGEDGGRGTGGQRQARPVPINSGTFDVSGVEAFFPELRTIPDRRGPLLQRAEEEKAGQRVCVIGLDVKKQLFGTRPDVAGATIAINSLPYRIVGVMADKDQNSSYSGLDEKKIWLPYTTMARDVPPDKYYVPGDLDEIIYQPRSLGAVRRGAQAGHEGDCASARFRSRR